jgi:mono/diheme cytochrome c family protein
MGRGIAWAAVGLLALGPPRISQAQAAATIDYTTQVHALFASKCLVCHSAEKRSGGLSLATYDDVLNGGRSGPAVRPGKSGSSILVQRITGAGATRMPLGGAALTAAEIGILTTWIDQGARRAPNAAVAKAKWEPVLALVAPKAPASPWENWNSGLDRFTAAYLASHGVAEPALVSDAVFARRAWLDVQGLLPTPEELRAFLDDPAPDKRRQLVARLLSDNKKYAEHWISYWNDLLRNDEGVQYYSETAGRKSITAWLQDALLTNKSYKEMVTKLLNPTEPGDPDGFLIGVNWRGTVSASQTPALQAAQNTAQVFLGVNLKCNSCHDSFISKWKLKDAYSLAAYFSSEEKLKLYRCDVAQDEYAQAGFLYPELNRPLASMSPAERRATAATIFTDPRNGRLPRTAVNRIWQRLMGRGIVENVDEMDGEPWSPELLDWLASDFVSNGYDLKRLIATILDSRTYQLAAAPRESETATQYTFRGPEVRRLTAEQFADAVASITGEWHAVAGNIRSPSGAVGGLSISGAPSDGANVVRPAARAVAAAPSRPAAPPPPTTPIPAGNFTRAWRIPGSSLDRALGRPIRDQVYSTRDTQATTIQALELVNGETLTHWLWRGARKMLGDLPPEPRALYAAQANAGRAAAAPFDLDISNSDKLYLIVQDSLSTAPDKAAPIWAKPELVGPDGATPLSALTPLDRSPLRDEPSAEQLPVKLNSVVVYDIAGKGFTHFRAAPGHEPSKLGQGETVLARFFVFDRQPAMDRLVPPNAETPLPPPPVLKTAAEAVDRVYWHALGRAPSPAERQIAEAALRDPNHPGKPSPDGLADLLWSVLMTPEFQLIR